MSALTDLDQLTDRVAREAARQSESGAQPAVIMEWAHAAKAAVDARNAARTPIEPSAVEDALSALEAELDSAGLLHDSVAVDIESFLRVVLTELKAALHAAQVSRAGVEAYGLVSERLQLVTGIAERSENPATMRMVAVSEQVLEDAENMVKSAVGGDLGEEAAGPV